MPPLLVALGTLLVVWTVMRIRTSESNGHWRRLTNRLPFALGITCFLAFQFGASVPSSVINISLLVVLPVYVWVFVKQKMVAALVLLSMSWLISENRTRILAITGHNDAADYWILVIIIFFAVAGLCAVLWQMKLPPR